MSSGTDLIAALQKQLDDLTDRVERLEQSSGDGGGAAAAADDKPSLFRRRKG